MATKIIVDEIIGNVTISKRSGQTSIRLAVSGGKVRVSQPTWLPFAAGEAFFRSRSTWVVEQLAKTPTKSYKQGQQIGKCRLLVIEFGDKRASRVTNDLVIATLLHGEVPSSVDAQHYISRATMRALRRDAEEHLPARLQELAYMHNFNFRAVTIKHLKRRWGSCTTKKDIALNLFLIELDQQHIDYVLLHELTHTLHMNHGSEFWAKLEQVCPGAKKLAKTVRRLQP